MATVVVLGHVAVALSHGGPVAVPDVPGYLAFAQWVAGGQPAPPFGYHPGYGLLLGPVALTGISPDGLHTAALVFNGLLAGACVLLAAGLARTLAPAGSRWLPVIAAGFAAVHPSLSSASRVAWTETLVITLVLATAYALARASTVAPSPLRFALVGWLATIGVAAHPRAAALAAAAVLAMFLLRPGWRAVAGGLAGAAVGTAMTMVALAVAYNGPTGGGRVADTVEAAGQGAGVLTTFSGQIAALAAGTAGLALLGLAEAVRRSVGSVRRPLPALGADLAATGVAVLLGAGAIGTLLVSGSSLSGSDRADTFAYGRYIDPYSVALMVFALATLAYRRRDVVVASLVVLVAATAVVWTSADLVVRPGMRIMVLATDMWWLWSDGRLLPALFAGSAVATVGLAAWLVARHAPAAGVVPLALFGVLAVTATITGHRHLAVVGEISAGQATASAVVREMGSDAPPCLAHDRTGVASYVMWLYRMQLPELEHLRVDLSAGESPCSELVVANLTEGVLATCPEATLLAAEPLGAWGLWDVSAGVCA